MRVWVNSFSCFWFLSCLSAETSMAEDYHLDQSDGKRYSVDPGDSAFSSITSSYSPKSSYGFRTAQQFNNSSASMSMCRQSSTSPNTFSESNRTGGNTAKFLKRWFRCFASPNDFFSLLLSFKGTMRRLSPKNQRLLLTRTHPPGLWKTSSGSSEMQTRRLWVPTQMSSENT